MGLDLLREHSENYDCMHLGRCAQSRRAGWFCQATILLRLFLGLLAETDPARNFTSDNLCFKTTRCFLEVCSEQQGMGTSASPPKLTTVAMKLNELGEGLGVSSE